MALSAERICLFGGGQPYSLLNRWAYRGGELNPGEPYGSRRYARVDSRDSRCCARIEAVLCTVALEPKNWTTRAFTPRKVAFLHQVDVESKRSIPNY
jgi:hypothetical protein